MIHGGHTRVNSVQESADRHTMGLDRAPIFPPQKLTYSFEEMIEQVHHERRPYFQSSPCGHFSVVGTLLNTFALMKVHHNFQSRMVVIRRYSAHEIVLSSRRWTHNDPDSRRALKPQ